MYIVEVDGELKQVVTTNVDIAPEDLAKAKEMIDNENFDGVDLLEFNQDAMWVNLED
jgi:hypothetical protein